MYACISMHMYVTMYNYVGMYICTYVHIHMYCSIYVKLSIMYMQKFAGPKKTRYISLRNQLSIKQKQCSYIQTNMHVCAKSP